MSSAQLAVDAIAACQAPLGADYIANILQSEARAFHPKGNSVWFKAMTSLLNQLYLLSISRTGAAMLREQGRIAHLMEMPLTPLEIALCKVLAHVVVGHDLSDHAVKWHNLR